mmetsp:Transcript_11728/g.25732  ORF Transcript_11728/g.25732 Transcript_11728/m.25732 type:complete len:319 (-) Transcript_11728:569-1525(-)
MFEVKDVSNDVGTEVTMGRFPRPHCTEPKPFTVPSNTSLLNVFRFRNITHPWFSHDLAYQPWAVVSCGFAVGRFTVIVSSIDFNLDAQGDEVGCLIDEWTLLYDFSKVQLEPLPTSIQIIQRNIPPILIHMMMHNLSITSTPHHLNILIHRIKIITYNLTRTRKLLIVRYTRKGNEPRRRIQRNLLPPRTRIEHDARHGSLRHFQQRRPRFIHEGSPFVFGSVIPPANVETTPRHQERLVPHVERANARVGTVGRERDLLGSGLAGIPRQHNGHGGIISRDWVGVAHFQDALDEYVGSQDGTLVVGGYVELASNVQSG